MIPELLRTNNIQFEISNVETLIDDASLEGGVGGRIGGIEYQKLDDDTIRIIAWQCNMADIQNFGVKLPTIIQMEIDSNKIVSQVDCIRILKGAKGCPARTNI